MCDIGFLPVRFSTEVVYPLSQRKAIPCLSVSLLCFGNVLHLFGAFPSHLCHDAMTFTETNDVATEKVPVT